MYTWECVRERFVMTLVCGCLFQLRPIVYMLDPPADGDREETEDSAELRRTESDSVLKKVETGSSQATI